MDKTLQKEVRKSIEKILALLDEESTGRTQDVSAILGAACIVCLSLDLSKEFAVEGFSKAFDFYKTLNHEEEDDGK